MKRVRAIVGRDRSQLGARLLGALGLVDQDAFRADVHRGPDDELCLVPTLGVGRLYDATGPRHWSEVELVGQPPKVVVVGDAVDGAASFTAIRSQRAASVLDLVLLLAVPGSAPRPEWRREVLFALPDDASLGRLVRRLLGRGIDHMRLGTPSGKSPHAGGALLAVKNAPAIVALQVLELDGAEVYYRAVDPDDADHLLDFWLPWGVAFPLLARARPQVLAPILVTRSGALVELATRDLRDVYAALDPQPVARPARMTLSDPGSVRVSVPLRLVAMERAKQTAHPELWIVPPERIGALADDLYLPEEQLDGLQGIAVRLEGASAPALVVWSPRGGLQSSFAGLSAAGADPRDGIEAYERVVGRAQALLAPVGMTLLPRLRTATVEDAFGLEEDTLTVLRPVPDGDISLLRLPLAGFRSLRDAVVEYTIATREQELLRVAAGAVFDFPEPIVQSDAGEGRARDGSPGNLAIGATRPAPPSAATVPALEASGPPRGRRSEVSPGAGAISATLIGGPGSVPSAGPGRSAQTIAQAVAPLVDPSSPDSSGAWLGLWEACRAGGRSADATGALVRALFDTGLQTEPLRRVVSAHLGLLGPGAVAAHAGRLLGPEPESPEQDPIRLANQVLTLYLHARSGGVAITDGRARRRLTNLSAQVREHAGPWTSWLLCRATHTLIRDPQVLDDGRLHVQRVLAELPLDSCVPRVVIEVLTGQVDRENEQAVAGFVSEAGLGPVAGFWFGIALALRSAQVGGAAVSAGRVDALRSELPDLSLRFGGRFFEGAEGYLDFITQVRGCPEPHPRRCPWRRHFTQVGARSQALKTYLVHEGMMQPDQPSTASEARERMAAFLQRVGDSDDDRAHALQTLWETEARRLESLGVLTQLPLAVGVRGDADLLDRLGAHIAAAVRSPVADADSQDAAVLPLMARVARVAWQIGRGDDAAAQHEARDVLEAAGRAFYLDGRRVTLWLLAALSHLPVTDRARYVGTVAQSLVAAGTLQDLGGNYSVTSRVLRILVRLASMLVRPADGSPAGEEIRRRAWVTLREVVSREYLVATGGGIVP